MKVILTQDIKNLGKKGDIKEVSDGYAHNYLIPRGMALEASAGKVKELEGLKAVESKKKAREEEQARRQQSLLEGRTIIVKAKAGEGGKLYGAVTSKEIADAIQDQVKTTIDKKKIEIKENIRHQGEYPVKIRIYPGIVAEIKVVVETQ